jgi:Carboxypeptidase regulatory-like domain
MSRYLLLLVFVGAFDLCAQQTGEIRGIVLDGQGRPVAGATVRCSRFDRPSVGVVPTGMTDERGEFFIAHLAAGDYHLDPSKEEDGYPFSYWGIYSDAQPARVALDALTHAVTGVVLVLGSKAAIFTGTISDAVTNKPISNATVHLWRTDKATFIESSQGSKFRVLLPTGVPVGISLRAAGYEDWDYKGVTESSITGASKFSYGEELNIDVKLTPTQ